MRGRSGRLERGEIESCLQSLTLGKTQLTPREIRMVLAFIDEDCSGTTDDAPDGDNDGFTCFDELG